MSTTAELDTVTKPESKAQTHVWRRPRYDVLENDDAFEVKVSLPGVKRDGVSVSVEGDTLSITAIRTHIPADGWRPLRRELPEGDYRLNLRLNVAIRAGNIRARIDSGILELTLPKADECKARKIKIN